MAQPRHVKCDPVLPMAYLTRHLPAGYELPFDMEPTPQIILLGTSKEARRRAEQLSQRIGAEVQVQPQTPVNQGVALVVLDDGLELRLLDRTGDPESGPTLRSAIEEVAALPASSGLTARQPLVRAIGRMRSGTVRVLDATAGLGRDAAMLARYGYDVTAVERHPILAALLEDSLERARRTCPRDLWLVDRLHVIAGDTRDMLRGSEVAADVMYIDPMFPPKRHRSALAPQSVRMIRLFVGDDDDAADLLAVGCRFVHRVVVKRPDHAPPLVVAENGGPAPTFSAKGKLVRYDVYINPLIGKAVQSSP